MKVKSFVPNYSVENILVKIVIFTMKTKYRKLAEFFFVLFGINLSTGNFISIQIRINCQNKKNYGFIENAIVNQLNCIYSG
jgi:hypothetical protein